MQPDVEQALGDLAGAAGHRAPALGIEQQSDHGLRQRGRIAFREDSRVAVAHDLVAAGGIDGDGRQATRRRFGENQALRLGLGGEEEDVGRLIALD